MNNIKLLVLDMDGVVNSDELIHNWFDEKFKELENQLYNVADGDVLRREVRKCFAEEFCHSTELIFPTLAKKVSTVCEKTDCFILWSSTWRCLEKYQNIDDARDMFNRRGLPGNRLVGYTPQLHMHDNGCRGVAIRTWINNNTVGTVLRAAVIDDRFDAGEGLPKCAKFFQTDEYKGITDKHVDDIISYLNYGLCGESND